MQRDSSLDVITFTRQKIGQDIQTRSVIRLAGGQPFDGGGGFWKLYAKENLGSLGTANFSADFDDIKAIRSLAAPVSFGGDFSFFGVTEVPFSVRVTDTAGEVRRDMRWRRSRVTMTWRISCASTVDATRQPRFSPRYGDAAIPLIRRLPKSWPVTE